MSFLGHSGHFERELQLEVLCRRCATSTSPTIRRPILPTHMLLSQMGSYLYRARYPWRTHRHRWRQNTGADASGSAQRRNYPEGRRQLARPDRVVKVTVLLARPDLYREMNEAYGEFFADAKPARSMVRFGADIPRVLIAIEAIRQNRTIRATLCDIRPIVAVGDGNVSGHWPGDSGLSPAAPVADSCSATSHAACPGRGTP